MAGDWASDSAHDPVHAMNQGLQRIQRGRIAGGTRRSPRSFCLVTSAALKEIEETSQHPQFHFSKAMNSTAKGPAEPS
jgi:hypothetical protein